MAPDPRIRTTSYLPAIVSPGAGNRGPLVAGACAPDGAIGTAATFSRSETLETPDSFDRPPASPRRSARIVLNPLTPTIVTENRLGRERRPQRKRTVSITP